MSENLYDAQTLKKSFIQITLKVRHLWEVEAGGSQGQELETIPVNMVKPRLY